MLDPCYMLLSLIVVVDISLTLIPPPPPWQIHQVEELTTARPFLSNHGINTLWKPALPEQKLPWWVMEWVRWKEDEVIVQSRFHLDMAKADRYDLLWQGIN